ncbi:MAG: NAD(+) synthase [Oscillospiraceae bacterium]|nr:NAD(+) synthase [Oscillospiraceae bacterium]
MKDGFIKVAAVTPEIKVADCNYNAEQIISLAREAAAKGAKIIVFPELCITGSTCGDLFYQQTLIESAEKALDHILSETAELDALIAVGLPVKNKNCLYNCAAVINKGDVYGLVPKTNIPENQSRYFESAENITEYTFTDLRNVGLNDIQLGSKFVFQCVEMSDLTVGFEIGSDMLGTFPVSDKLAASGASVICNLAASAEIAGRAERRRSYLSAQSERLAAAYIYAESGFGESTQDMVFAGHNIICESGHILAESKRFTTGITITEIDVSKLMSERRRKDIFRNSGKYDAIFFELSAADTALTRKFSRMPFIPENKDKLAERCGDILQIQAADLASRLKKINCKNAVIGLSGGLDSTLALIVTVHAFDMLSYDRKGILTVTMPCFGTTSRTKNNAYQLAEAYGIELREVNIAASVRQHFADIGHYENNHDVTYENSQARERTQVLMDIANQTGGIVIGTGDLSELALGWATYNGDHMSMYGVNGSVPKTLVRHIVAYESENGGEKLSAVLDDILDTPVSPELLPPSENGEIAQKTEDIVGPYELHDFFMYYLVRFGFSLSKIFRIASAAFDGVYDSETIKKWLKTFVRRFFTQQFKRSCLPDGPKVGSVSLSPRGDFCMPSDASAALWTAEAEAL